MRNVLSTVIIELHVYIAYIRGLYDEFPKHCPSGTLFNHGKYMLKVHVVSVVIGIRNSDCYIIN